MGNQFAVLEIEEIRNENVVVVQKQIQANSNAMVVQKNWAVEEPNNQLVVVEYGNNQTPTPSTTPTGKTLNAAAPEFNPTSPRTGVSKDGNKDSSIDKVKEKFAPNKESTSQWVQRTFGGNLVATNTSCQEIPSQDSFDANKLVKESGKIQLGEGKLWSHQTKEDSEENELLGDEEDSDAEDITEDDQDGE